MRRLGLAAGIIVILCATLGGAIALEDADLLGTWEGTADGNTVTIVFHADGTGDAREVGGDGIQLRWRLDAGRDPAHLHFRAEGENLISLVEIDTPDRLRMTEPESTLPAGFGEARVLVFRRIAAADGTSTRPERPEHPDIYARLGLDISTPLATTQAFLDAAGTYDGLAVYFLLAPQAREFAWRSAVYMMQPDIFGVEITGDDGARQTRDLFEALAPLMAEESTNPNQGFMIVEPWPMIEALFDWSAQNGRTPFTIVTDPVLAPTPTFRFLDDGLTAADVQVTGTDGTMVVHLLSSSTGRWRVLGVTQDVGGDPHTWLISEP